jgi:type III pantothenate kinase
MILLLDIGNTRLKWALLADGKLGQQHALVYRPESLPAELEQAWSALPPPRAVYLVSVAASVITQGVQDWAARRWGCRVVNLQSTGRNGGVVNGYTRPERLGVDRWMAMIGAYRLVGSALCVIDCGTALTCDAIDSHGNHLGGVIAPGQEMMRRALLHNTAGIAVAEVAARVTDWGQDTTGCVVAGTVQATVGLIERMVTKLQSQLGVPVTAILTGGDAEQLLPLLSFPCRYEADLVLQGIVCIVADQRG